MILRPQGLVPNIRRSRELHDEDRAQDKWAKETCGRRGRRGGHLADRRGQRMTGRSWRSTGSASSSAGSSALQGLDMHVDEGEILSVIGPNGAGKSTLFNVITRALRARRRETSRSAASSIVGLRAASGGEARDRPHVPERAPVPEHDGPGERDGGPALPVQVRHLRGRAAALPSAKREEERIREPATAGAGLLRHAARRTTARSSRRSRSRTRTAGGWRWLAPWRPTPRSCCSTSRPPG